MQTTPPKNKREYVAYAVFLAGFLALSVFVTYPLAFNLSQFVVVNINWADQYMQAWTLAWDIHALLSGPDGIFNFLNANIFYPYANSLIFTEHLLGLALLVTPFVLLGSTPLVAINLTLIITTTLAGWGMYLLVTWITGNKWAGLLAGVLFVVTPFRLSTLSQPNLLANHWVPFIFLTMGLLIKHNRTKDLILLLLFTNLQFFSVINYAFLATLGLGVWTAFLLYGCRNQLTLSLFVRLGVYGLVTLALNLPVLRVYQQMSQHMGVVRTLGDAKLFGASIINYVLPMGNSLLYGRWLGLPTQLTHTFPGVGVSITAFPGAVMLTLAIVGVVFTFKVVQRQDLKLMMLAFIVISTIGFVFSFGANDQAFGVGLSPIVKNLLPYPMLYQVVPVLQGFRVPLRFAMLFTFGMVSLAGLGFAVLSQMFKWSGRTMVIVALLLSSLAIIEHLPIPIPGALANHGKPVYKWLNTNTPADAVILELPYLLNTKRSYEEAFREYESTAHWRRLVNGLSGFRPDGSEELGVMLDSFPDWRAFDALQQLGVDYIVLNRSLYEPDDWENIVGLLPAYLPAIEQFYSVDDRLTLKLAPSDCAKTQPEIYVDATRFPELSFTNIGATTWFADPGNPSYLVADSRKTEFLEPLFVLPGETANIRVNAQNGNNWQIYLANLDKTIDANSANASEPDLTQMGGGQPVDITYANQAVLQEVAFEGTPTACSTLKLALQWQFASFANESAVLELIDQFNRVAITSKAIPVKTGTRFVSTHFVPLAGTIPAGQYRLQIRLVDEAEDNIPALNPDGAPMSQPPVRPLVVRPKPLKNLPNGDTSPLDFANGVTLLGSNAPQLTAAPGDWLRFALFWKSSQPLATDTTVFTQLIGPDGQVWAQRDNSPKGGWYPTSLWLPNEIVQDDYAIRIDPLAPPGEYRLVAGLYNPVSGERVSIASGQDFVTVATIMANDE